MRGEEKEERRKRRGERGEEKEERRGEEIGATMHIEIESKAKYRFCKNNMIETDVLLHKVST